MPDYKGTVKPWPLPTGVPLPMPRWIKRPAEYGLDLVIIHLETQLGTIEAYNRLCSAAARVKAQIDAGNAKAQNPLYAVSVRGE